MAVAASVAFLSASQDIAIDAWRIEVFPERSQGTALAAYVWGYRAALLVSRGGGHLRLRTYIGWHGAFLAVAALVALGPVLTLLAPAPAVTAVRRGRDGLLARRRGAAWWSR